MDIVLVGGCAPLYYDLAAVVGAPRPTDDIDLLVGSENYSDYQAAMRNLARATDTRDKREGAGSTARGEREPVGQVRDRQGVAISFFSLNGRNG